MKLINNIECYNSGWTILFFQSEIVAVSKAALGAVAGGDVETGKVTVDDGCADADVEAVLFGVKASCFRHALPKSRLTQSSTSRYSSACSSSMPSITLVGRVWPGLV